MKAYLTIIARARIGSESIAHEAEGQLVGKKYRDKTTLASKTRFSRYIVLVFKAGAFATSGL